jgi:hypothetical protein
MSSNLPLPPYKEPLYYTGVISVIGVGFFIYQLIQHNTSPNSILPPMLIAVGFGAITYYLWITRCPRCKRSLSKKEIIEWKEDLGVKSEPYTYSSKRYRYTDGSTEPVQGSEKTIMRDKQYHQHYFSCKNCGYGSNHEWSEIKSLWLGQDPEIQYITKKGTAPTFGLNMFNEDYSDSNGKRKAIPKGVKIDLWTKHFGQEYVGNCIVCGKTINTHNFEAGHIISVANNGSDNISNLKPICRKCNGSMGTRNLYEYKDEHYSKKH